MKKNIFFVLFTFIFATDVNLAIEPSSIISNITCSDDVCLSFGNVDESSGTMEIVMTNSVDVAGFQFNIEGATLTGGAGGTAEEAYFMVSTSATTVIGFSLTGSVISPGTGILTNLTFSDLGTYSCLQSPIVSDVDGQSLEVSLGDCIGDAPVYGCIDDIACNFDIDATTSDGSCEYQPTTGCTDPDDKNYNPDAEVDDGT